MPTYQKRSGNWRAIIRKKGLAPISETFSTKAEAVAWATRTELDIADGKRGNTPNKTFAQLLERYRDEVSASKRGARWETARIDRFIRDDELAKVKIGDLAAHHCAAWRDRRLREVSPGSVRREWNLLSHAINIAVKEWGWLKANPMQTVSRPPPPRARDRIFGDDEIERILFAAGYEHLAPPETTTARVGAALLFAIETAMRAGEIVALQWPDIQAEKRFLRVRGEDKGGGKTAAARRDVALSAEALRLIAQLEGVQRDGEPVFRIGSTQSLDALFRKTKAKAAVDGVTFHDSRATAITRLAKKLDILALARMVGHRDLKMLQIYYRASAEEIAGKL